MVRWPGWVRAALTALLIVIVGGALPSQSPGVSAQGGGSINYGSKVLGRISAELPEVAYSFNGSTGDLVQVRVRNWVGTLDPQVSLLTPDGATAASSTRSAFGPQRQDATLALFLPQTGVYMLLVGAEGGTNGQFLLTLQGRAPVSATPLAYDTGLDVAVPLDPQPQYFTFEAQDCPTVFSVANLSEGLPFTFPYMVKVRSAQGGLIALLDGGDAVEDRLILPPLSGRYEVEVLSEDPEQQGTIHLLVTCADRAPGCVGAGTSGAAAGAQGAANECPSCFAPDECPDFVLTAVNEGSPEFLFTWPEVEGALYYYFSIVDAWGALVPGSGWMSEGDTTHIFTIPDAALDRGPFTAFVQASNGAGVSLCSDDVTFTFDGTPTEECTGIAVQVDAIPGARAAVASWTPVPGAAAYMIHVYAYGEDAGLIGIRVLTVPGSENSFHLTDVFPGDYNLFRIDVRAYGEAAGGGAFGDMPQGFLCGGSADVEFPKTGPVEWGPAA